MEKEGKDKICPLSFGFSVRNVVPAPTLRIPGPVDKQQSLQVKIGFPCPRTECEWWDSTAQQCIIKTIEMLLGRMVNLLEEKKKESKPE